PGFSTKNSETGISYDPNGNIKNLDRYDGLGVLKQNFTKYNYASNTNKLISIDGYNKLYDYNEIGQIKTITNTTDNSVVHHQFNVRGNSTSMDADPLGTQPLMKSFYNDNGLCYKKEM